MPMDLGEHRRDGGPACSTGLCAVAGGCKGLCRADCIERETINCTLTELQPGSTQTQTQTPAHPKCCWLQGDNGLVWPNKREQKALETVNSAQYVEAFGQAYRSREIRLNLRLLAGGRRGLTSRSTEVHHHPRGPSTQCAGHSP